MLELIGVPEAAQILGVTEPAIRQAIQEDRIVGAKIKGRYYAVKESVDAYKPREYRSAASSETPTQR